MKPGVLSVCMLAFACAAAAAQPSPQPRKISVLIVDGMNNHDWPRATRILRSILEQSGRFDVTVSTTPPATQPVEPWQSWRPRFDQYDVVLSNFNGGYRADTGARWPREVEQSLETYMQNGGGLVIFHAANNSFPTWPAYNEMIGLGWRSPDFGPSIIIDRDEHLVRLPPAQGRKPGHGPEHDFKITVLTSDHPITRGLPKSWLHPHEQLTHGQHGSAKNMTILTYAWSKDVDENEPMDWVVPYGKGRVYTTMQGHLWKDGPDTALRCVAFQTLLLRGTEWAATGTVTIPIPDDFPTADRAVLRQ